MFSLVVAQRILFQISTNCATVTVIINQQLKKYVKLEKYNFNLRQLFKCEAKLLF